MGSTSTASFFLVALLPALSCIFAPSKARADEKQPKVIVFTGWGQSPSSLDGIVPENWNITRFPYYEHKSIADLTASLKESIKSSLGPDVVIGWSLGGRISAILVDKKVLRPTLLVIIASGFKIKPGEGLDKITHGMPFSDLFESNPSEARARLGAMIAKGDSKSSTVLEMLNQDKRRDKEWGIWLANRFFSSEQMNFSHFPRTLLIYGKNDNLISLDHFYEYRKHIPINTGIVLPGAGHAPHLHDADHIRREILRHWKIGK